MPDTPATVLAVGLVLGMRHALDVDHLAAVSAIVSQRRTISGSVLVGALWGLGHTATLLAAALAMVMFHVQMPQDVARWCELGVAAVLVGLGVSVLGPLWRGGCLHLHIHEHDGLRHVHPHLHRAGEEHAHRHGPSMRRPVLVGMAHGLAGSAALMLAVLATIPTPFLALAYVTLFAAGSIGGMVAMSTLLGVPVTWLATHSTRGIWWLRAGAAVASIAVGIHLAWALQAS